MVKCCVYTKNGVLKLRQCHTGGDCPTIKGWDKATFSVTKCSECLTYPKPKTPKKKTRKRVVRKSRKTTRKLR